MKKDLPIIIAVTGASGSVYSFRLLKFLLENKYNVHLIFSENALYVVKQELGISLISNPQASKEIILSHLGIDKDDNHLEVFSNTDFF